MAGFWHNSIDMDQKHMATNIQVSPQPSSSLYVYIGIAEPDDEMTL